MASKYEDQATSLVQAIEIAIDSFSKFPPKDWNDDIVQHVVTVYLERKESILNPVAGFKNITSLNYLKNDVFTYFQESAGKTVDYFWREIKRKDLPYKRENKMSKILRSGKIKSEIQYDFVSDVIVPYQEEGLITEGDVILLNKLISEFEGRMSKGHK